MRGVEGRGGAPPHGKPACVVGTTWEIQEQEPTIVEVDFNATTDARCPMVRPWIPPLNRREHSYGNLNTTA